MLKIFLITISSPCLKGREKENLLLMVQFITEALTEDKSAGSLILYTVPANSK